MANLNPSVLDPPSTPYSTQKAITDYIANGVTTSKIIMGLPLYGRSFEETAGLGLPFTGVGSGSWEAGVWDYKVLPRAGATEYYDSEVVGSYSYDGSTEELISYDNVETIKTKANYIMNTGLGGAMFWESSGDRNDTESLISTTAGIFPGLDQSQNLLTYSASAYANLAAGMPGE
jgi:chitinase